MNQLALKISLFLTDVAILAVCSFLFWFLWSREIWFCALPAGFGLWWTLTKLPQSVGLLLEEFKR